MNLSFFQNFLSKFSGDIAIDLGTANIRVFSKDNNQTVKEPSIIAFNTTTGKVLAVGNEARVMVGRTPENIVAVQPLKDGVVSDFNATEAMINYFIVKTRGNSKFMSTIVRPRVIIGVPSLITEVEINAVIDSAKSAGARRVYVVVEPVAAAIGAELPIEDPRGNMIVDIGGGTTDIAVISLGGIIIDNTINIAGDEMDQSIVDYIKNKYNLLIGTKMAEDVKVTIGYALSNKTDDQYYDIKGQDLVSGLPRSTKISSVEITEALSPILDKIHDAIKDAVEKSPPEIISDLLTNGIYLSGGGALIKNLDKYLSQRLKIPVKITQDPVFSVIKGLGKLLDNINLLEKFEVKDLILR